jgi:glycosyltransferase involved in cell wall biosynthesis
MPSSKVAIYGWGDSEHIVRWVDGLVKRDYQVRVFSCGGTPVPHVPTTITPYFGPISYLIGAPKALIATAKFKPDLLHVHYASGFGLWGLVAGVSPTIVSVWGSDIVEFTSGAVGKWFMRKVLHKAAHVTATSHFLLDHAVELLPELKDRISLVSFGVPVLEQVAAPPATLPVKLCYIKSHRPVYGPHILIKAFALARHEIPDLQLSVAGRGEYTKELMRLVIALKLQKSVEFVGYIPNEEIYKFLVAHHIMVMPSLQESFGVAALEAGACGRPVIATRVGGIPEIVLNNRTGLLVPPNDVDALAEAIVTLARDEEQRRAMGRAAYEFVRDNYSWEKSLDQMCGIYERALNEKKSHSTL